jgi:hypothetical protein
MINTGLATQQMTTNRKKMTFEELKKQMAKWEARDAELVTGRFQNLENRGAELKFTYKAYKSQQNEIYELQDGETYTIPFGVAYHLNNNCFWKEYTNSKGVFDAPDAVKGGLLSAPDGRRAQNTMQIAKKVHRFAFHSLDFSNVNHKDLAPSTLLEVTVSP